MIRHLYGYLASIIIGGLLLVFIALPIGAVLIESFVVNKPFSLVELKAVTLDSLEKLDPSVRKKTVSRWLKRAKPRERMEATAAALELSGKPVSWNRKAAFDIQIDESKKVIAALGVDARVRFDAEFPISYVMLHKRIPLAFKIKSQINEEEFDRLRTGQHKEFGLHHYVSVITDQRLVNAALNSLFFAVFGTVIASTLAFCISYGINRGGIGMPNLVRYATLIPLVSPPVIIATAAVLLFGRNGAVTNGLLDNTLGWIDAETTNLYGVSGVIIAQVLSTLPAAFIIIDNVLSSHDGRVEEAAAIQGATPWQVFIHVTLPLAQPGIIRSLILVFILIMTDFANPLVIGKDIPVLAGILYDEIIGFQNTELSAAIAVWLIVPALCIYFLLERIGRNKRYTTGNAAGGPPELPMPRSAKFLLTTVAVSVISLTVLLYGTIIVGSFIRLWGVDNSFTLNWYLAADAMPGFESEWTGVEVVWSSLAIALVAAPLGGLLAVALAYLIERVRPVGSSLMSFVTMMPAILPGVIFGVGYIVAFNFPFGIEELALTGTMAILVLNILFGNIFVGVLAGRAALQRLDASVDEAAEILGASLVQRFFRVVLPMMRHAAILGTLYVFVHGMTTLSAVVFLVSPGNQLASVAIFETASRSIYGVASAMSVTILLIVFTVMGAMWWFERHGPSWARLGADVSGRT